jgi:nickel-type superoxide dismutase maturation protease
MAPTLRSGDFLLVDPDAYRISAPRPGMLVLVPDPRQPRRLLVKRVTEIFDGGATLWVGGDAPGASTDSRAFGAVEAEAVEGRPWFRYWPPRRWGRVH